jgi:hypothetical protein
MDELLKAIAKHPNGTGLIIKLRNSCTIIGEIDTIYETYNDLDFDDPNYEEYYACVFLVTDIIGHSDEKDHFSKGDLVEISMQNPPLEVCLKDRTIIWSAS